MRRIADNDVAVDRFAELARRRLGIVSVRHDANIRAMDLPTTGERPLARKKLEKAATILQNVLRGVIVEAGETERVRRHLADAAETRGEAVYKTICFKWSTDERANSVELAPVETRFV